MNDKRICDRCGVYMHGTPHRLNIQKTKEPSRFETIFDGGLCDRCMDQTETIIREILGIGHSQRVA